MKNKGFRYNFKTSPKVVNITVLVIAYLFALPITFISGQTFSQQENFDFRISLQEIDIPEMQPIHSFAYATSGDDILLVGGRIDGLHARQPFASFPLAYNNTNLIVLNIKEKKVWTAPLDIFPTTIREQLQSTNMNFHQVADTLYIMGGYAYSPSADNHITFPYLTTLIVSNLIEGIKNSTIEISLVKQATDSRYANTGGQMGKIADEIVVVGGNIFTGRYNPMGNPTYTQHYLPEIRFYTINNSSEQPVLQSYRNIADNEHLRRRDYNLLPYIFTDGSPGYLVSAGVFRPDALLPFLYPVEIGLDAYYPHKDFEQLLSHYHSPKLSFRDDNNYLHMIFFGGLAQYYYQNDMLIKDDNVPFVDTISRLTRKPDGTFKEYVLPNNMPGLKGTNAEFIPNKSIEQNETGVFLLDNYKDDLVLSLGYIIGGIETNEINPFINNRTQFTSASVSIYEVFLERETNTSIPIQIPTQITLNQNYPNPFNPSTIISFVLPTPSHITLDVYNMSGQHIQSLINGTITSGLHNITFSAGHLSSGLYFYKLTAPETTLTKKMTFLK